MRPLARWSRFSSPKQLSIIAPAMTSAVPMNQSAAASPALGGSRAGRSQNPNVSGVCYRPIPGESGTGKCHAATTQQRGRSRDVTDGSAPNQDRATSQYDLRSDN